MVVIDGTVGGTVGGTVDVVGLLVTVVLVGVTSSVAGIVVIGVVVVGVVVVVVVLVDGSVGMTVGSWRGLGIGLPENNAIAASRMNAARACVAARVRWTESTYEAGSVAASVRAQSARKHRGCASHQRLRAVE